MRAQKLRVLFLANIPSPYRVDFFNELGKSCELTVLFERQLSSERKSSWHKNDFQTFQGVFLKGIKLKANTAICVEIIKYLKKDQYDVIVIGGYSTPTGMLAIEYLKVMNIPFILNTDGGFVKKEPKWKYKLKKRYIQSASNWLSTGKCTTDYLVHYGAAKRSIHVYPFSSIHECEIVIEPTNDLEKSKLRNKLKLTENKIVLTVGRFIPIKGFDILLRAAVNSSKDIGFYIVGGRPTREYERLIDDLGLTNVHFIDFKSSQELREYYIASDLFVLPTRGDIWGLVVNEAMACGLPVITTNKCIAGLELVMQGENGFITQSENDKEISEKISFILENKEISKKMQAHSINVIKQYTIESMAQAHVDVFKKIRMV